MPDETGSARSETDFSQETLDKTVIAVPLLDWIEGKGPGDGLFSVIVDLNLLHGAALDVARQVVHLEIVGHERWGDSDPGGEARKYVKDASDDAKKAKEKDPNVTVLNELTGITTRSLDAVVDKEKGRFTPQYVYATLEADEIRALADIDANTDPSAIYKIWPDFLVEAMLTRSVATVKGDAARIAFSAVGSRIVWAVADTGIQFGHPHFDLHSNLDISDRKQIDHMDFTGDKTAPVPEPEDPNGHGTHVAGIIGGESIPEDPKNDGKWDPELWTSQVERNTKGKQNPRREQLKQPISGVAPRCKLVSLRVLDDNARGRVSNLLAAIGYIQQVNEYGRWIRIHGLNMSVGYGFDPEWFACGQSPLCVEVDRLVQSGVSVVVAAGNTGYWKRGATESNLNSGLDLTINDPGNAEQAITVGSTHPEEPHVYGVSYFSSKGPTGDGRLKPDLVAPGEKVLSAAAGPGSKITENGKTEDVHYRQESGTSMAAPHVSGAIAAFLSIRREFIGQPQRVKEIFLSSATDLGREPYFQGRGLVDLMRAIQSV